MAWLFGSTVERLCAKGWPFLPQVQLVWGVNQEVSVLTMSRFRLLDDPSVSFDFSNLGDPTWHDWIITNGKDAVPWNPSIPPPAGEKLIYCSPHWGGSEMSASIDPTCGSTVSLLFPYRDEKHYVETRIVPGPRVRIEVVRHQPNSNASLGEAVLDDAAGTSLTLGLQSAQGLFAVFVGGRRLIEANEYALLDGTMAILLGGGVKYFPIRRIDIRRNEMLHDSFPAIPSGALTTSWRVARGTWRVATDLESDIASDDGQLVAQGEGEIYIGEDQWAESTMEILARFDTETELALLGWAHQGEEIELDASLGRIRLRKVVNNISVVLAEAPVAGLGDGWHRLGLNLGQRSVEAEVDGRRVVSVPMAGGKGCAGLRNYGPLGVFDDLTIRVLSREKTPESGVKPVDSGVMDIEESISK